MSFPRIATLNSPDRFRGRLDELGLDLAFDDEVLSAPDSPLAGSVPHNGRTIGNRFCILPMEGWDAEPDGSPSDLVRRRWANFGLSGAKLIWGGEAVAVRRDGRANPNQLLLDERTQSDIAGLRELLERTHRETFGTTDDLYVGLQLTHSGRFARPNEKSRPEPRVAYRHPVLDRRVGVVDDGPLLSDDDLERLIADFVVASRRAAEAGFAFVDVKHCHGYLGHELLSAYDRDGRFGGGFENRTRFLREIVAGIRAEAPTLDIAVRVSVFDYVPFRPGDDGVGIPESEAGADYPYAFGGDGTGLGIDLDEPSRFLDLLRDLGIRLVCPTAGSPYYNPHIQRPAIFPPSDGYQPPEDPLVGVVRQIEATAELKRRHPDLLVVGSAYSYLQEWLPNVGQRIVRDGGVDFVGLGRMVLSYPDLPADVLVGRALVRKKICRTFSDCTTAPRNGMVSGCYPLDPFYKDRPERARLVDLKSGDRKS